MEKAEFVTAMLEAMEDTDWSRHTALQDVTLGEQKAAAVLLWQRAHRKRSGEEHGGWEWEVDTEAMIQVLKDRYGYSSDPYEFADSEKDMRSFMDQADDLNLPHHLRDDIVRRLSHTLTERYEEKGWSVVELRESTLGPDGVSSQEEGFYVFTTS